MTQGILHVVTSPSFIDTVASVFDVVAPGANTVATMDVASEKLRLPGTARVETFTHTRESVGRLEELVAKSRVAIFHSVSPITAKVLASAPPSVLRVWSGWGGDYYGSAFDPDAGVLGASTRRLLNSTVRPTFYASRAVFAMRYGPVLRAAARAADVFSAPVPADLEVFRARFSGFNGSYRQLNYVSVEDSIASDIHRPLGQDILVGNSAAPANNHVEVFELLSRQDLSGRRVIVPLSYGNSFYAARVLSAGQDLLGDHFEPITNFMSLDAYNELLARCGTVMMGSYRQMALGNILRAVWQGAQVVLDRRNPIHRYLQDRGAAAMLLDDVDTHGLPSAPLSAAQVAGNHAFLDQYWSRSALIRNARALISPL